MAARHLQWCKTHPLCLIMTRTAPGHAHSIAEQILLLLSTTVSEACWTTVTHAWHEKKVVKYFWNKIKKTITWPLWTTTPLLSNFRARPQSLANCLRAVPSSYNQRSLAGMDTKNKQTKPMKNASPSLQSSLCLSKWWKPHHRTPRKKKNAGPIMFASLLITRLELVAHLRFHRNQWRLRPHTSGTNPHGGQSDDCQVPASSRAASKVSSLLFKNRISVKCYLSIVSHIRKTVVGAAMSWRSCGSGSRQTDFTTLPVTSAETNHHTRKKYQIHTYTNARSKDTSSKSTSTAQMGFDLWSDVTPHQSSVGKETRWCGWVNTAQRTTLPSSVNNQLLGTWWHSKKTTWTNINSDGDNVN